MTHTILIMSHTILVIFYFPAVLIQYSGKKLESFVDEIFGKSQEKIKRNVLVYVENEIQRICGILIYNRSTETASKAILDENEDQQIIREVHQDKKHVEGRASRVTKRPYLLLIVYEYWKIDIINVALESRH